LLYILIASRANKHRGYTLYMACVIVHSSSIIGRNGTAEEFNSRVIPFLSLHVHTVSPSLKRCAKGFDVSHDQTPYKEGETFSPRLDQLAA